MDFSSLKKALAAEAQAAGICSEWYNFILSAQSKERLIALYYKGFDFVEDNDFPSEPLRREFDDIRRNFGIYEGEQFNTKNPRRLVAYTGAKGSAEYSNFAAAQVWARPGSEVEVTASDHAFVSVSVAKGAIVRVKASGYARVIVFLHGGSVAHEASEHAIVKIKE